jgi:hypothetical protein
MPRPAVLLAAILLIVGVLAVPAASATTTEPAKAYGVCISKSTGAMRVLERTNLDRSRYGKCKTTETKLTLPSISGLPKLPTKLVFHRNSGTDTCTKTGASTASTWVFACDFDPVPTPSPAS